MKKILPIIFILFVLFLISFVLARNVIVKTGLERGMEYATGLPLSIGEMQIGLRKSVIRLTDIQLRNPKEYSEPIMINVSEVYINYDLNDIIKKYYHFHEIRLDLKELNVIRRKDGKINLEALKPAQEDVTKEEDKTAEGGKSPDISKFQIDKLRLKLGKVVYKDYSQKDEPSVQEFPINMEEEFDNINDVHGFVSLIVMRALTKTSVAQLANFNPRHLQGTIKNTLNGLRSIGQGTLNETVDTIKSTLKNFKIPAGK